MTEEKFHLFVERFVGRKGHALAAQLIGISEQELTTFLDGPSVEERIAAYFNMKLAVTYKAVKGEGSDED